VLHRDPERLRKLRIAVRYLLQRDAFRRGHQTRLAEHFQVSRQRVHQVVNEEQRRRTPPLPLSPVASEISAAALDASGQLTPEPRSA